MLGPFLFLVMMLATAPSSRDAFARQFEALPARVGPGFLWVYAIVFFVLGPLFSYMILVTWPARNDLKNQRRRHHAGTIDTEGGIE
jgi:hypothetical protein